MDEQTPAIQQTRNLSIDIPADVYLAMRHYGVAKGLPNAEVVAQAIRLLVETEHQDGQTGATP